MNQRIAPPPAVEEPSLDGVESPPPTSERSTAMDRARDATHKYALIGVLVLLFLLFTAVKPDAFATSSNLRTLLSVQSVLAILALAVIVPLIAGEFDLSIAFTMGLAALLVVGLPANQGVPWWAAMLLVLLIGVAIGCFNAFLIVFLKLNSFIATLATGVLISGITEWYSGGSVIYEGVPSELVDVSRSEILGLPLSVYYLLVLSIILWFVIGYLPFGRYLHATGGGREAARLAGVRTARTTVLALVIGSVIASFAGIVLAGRLGSGHPDAGSAFLLPAFAAAFLGATCWKPGNFNVLGTVVAVYTIAILINGLQLLGAPFWAEDILQGLALIVAVTLSQVAQRGGLRR